MQKYTVVNLYNMYNYGELMQLTALKHNLTHSDITLFSLYSIVDSDKCAELDVKYCGDIKPIGIKGIVIKTVKLTLLAALDYLGIKPVRGQLKILKDSDVIIDMGGDTFSDYPSMTYTFMHSASLLLATLLRKDYVILSQSVGEFNNIITKNIAKYFLSRANYIVIREYHTLNYLLDELKLDSARIKLVPDIGYLCGRKQLRNKEKAIGLITASICEKQGGLSNDDNLELLTRIGRYYNSKGYEVLLIPHVLCPVRNMGINKELNDYVIATELNGILNNSRIIKYTDMDLALVVIGSRLHGCINALNHNVPVIALAYSKKFYTLDGNSCILSIKDVYKNNSLLYEACNNILGIGD